MINFNQEIFELLKNSFRKYLINEINEDSFSSISSSLIALFELKDLKNKKFIEGCSEQIEIALYALPEIEGNLQISLIIDSLEKLIDMKFQDGK